MEFTDVVRRRRMVRRYDPARPVEREVLLRCLDNATRAPSAGFSQGWDFLVLVDPAHRAAFWQVTSGAGSGEPHEPHEPPDAVTAHEQDAWLRGLMSAPVLIVCCSHKDAYLDRYAEPDKGWTDRDEARWPVPYWDIDTGMASLLILLTAVDEGLGGCFFGVPPEHHDAVHERFAIPQDRSIIGVISLGYAVPGPKSPSLRRGRRSVDGERAVAHWGRFDA